MKIFKVSGFDEKYDLAIFGLGYETRSTFAALEIINKCKISNSLAIGYTHNQEAFNYKKNKSTFNNKKIKTIEKSDNETIEEIENEISTKRPKSIIIDITVMSRHRISCILSSISKKSENDTKVTIVYSPSIFIPPPEGLTPIKMIGEICPYLSGELGDLSLPTAAIIALGYERDKALGLSNYLESDRNIYFIPESSEEDFKKYVYSNNEDILSNSKSSTSFEYSVEEPYRTYTQLKSLLIELQDNFRPILVPLGPKIFTAISVLVGIELHPKIPIWRVSSEHTETPEDRKENGRLITINYTT